MIALDDLTINNLGLVNVITGESFSKEQLEEFKESGELAQFAYFKEVPVGVVVSKPVQPVHSKSPVGLLIDVCSVLPAYSSKYDVERQLLSHIEEITKKRHLDRVYVATENPAQWEAFGFAVEDHTQELYRGLELVKQGRTLLRKDLSK